MILSSYFPILQSSFETKPLLTFMTNTFMRFEQSKRLCFLVSVGILKLVDLLPVKTFLSAFQSGVIRNIMSDISDNIDELIVSDGVGIYGTNKLQMYLWAKFFEYLSTCEESSSYDSTEVHALVDFLFSSKYQVNIIPVGSRSKVCSSTDIYNHWKTIVLPALSFRWDDVDMQWLSLIGLQALYHSFVIGTCSHLNKESFNRANLKGTAMMHLTTVAAWGETNITTAWKDILVLSWKHLSVGYSSMAEDKDIKCMQIESSDIPCEDSKHKEIHELLPIPDQGVESVESIEVQQRADEIDDINDVAMDELTALIDIQSPPMNTCFSLGNDLVRDLKSCLIPCEDDLSSRQVRSSSCIDLDPCHYQMLLMYDIIITLTALDRDTTGGARNMLSRQVPLWCVPVSVQRSERHAPSRRIGIRGSCLDLSGRGSTGISSLSFSSLIGWTCLVDRSSLMLNE